MLWLPTPTISAILAPSSETRSPSTEPPGGRPITATGIRFAPSPVSAITWDDAAGSLSTTHNVPVSSQLGLLIDLPCSAECCELAEPASVPT